MAKRDIDPDLTRLDDPAYWAAALMLAIRAGDAARAATASRHLRRMGYRLDAVPAAEDGASGEGVGDAK